MIREYDITVRIRVDSDESTARWAYWASKRTELMHRTGGRRTRKERWMLTLIDVLGSTVKAAK